MIRNYEEETQKSVDSFLYLKGIMEELMQKVEKRAKEREEETRRNNK
jgi:hypothetical protein